MHFTELMIIIYNNLFKKIKIAGTGIYLLKLNYKTSSNQRLGKCVRGISILFD